MNLESFLCHGLDTRFKINLSPFETLRNLILTSLTLKDQRLEGLIFRLPYLESNSILPLEIETCQYL